MGRSIFLRRADAGSCLSYLVEHTLKGDADKINEYAIGLEVFQRPDRSIRALNRWCERSSAGCASGSRTTTRKTDSATQIVIDFPPRSYVASFTFREAAKLREPTAFPETARAPQLVPPSARQTRRVWIIGAIAVLCIAAGAVAGIMLWRQHVSLAVAKQPIHAIVVLPFEDYSPNHQDEYIADGITEELTNDLAQWRDMRVVARTSAFAFKGKGEDMRQIGQQLNVDTVLEGSFTRLGDHVRITAQLNRATDGYHLWSHSYETQSKRHAGHAGRGGDFYYRRHWPDARRITAGNPRADNETTGAGSVPSGRVPILLAHARITEKG